MNLKTHFILLLSGILLLGFTGLQEVNYEPRSLLKQITKQWNQEDVSVTEIELDRSLIDSLFIKGKFFEVHSQSAGSLGYAYVGRVNCCRMGGCSSDQSNYAVYDFEYFDYFILFDSKASVKTTKIYNYAASHGQQICAKGWLKQFVSYAGKKELIVGKNIDSISGATISTNSITFDIMDKQALLAHILSIGNTASQ